MYSWGDDMEDWARPGAYKFDEARKAAREADASASRARGGRTYQTKSKPDESLTDPKKTIVSASANPLVVAVDVTGSMQTWPFEIFDRLPLLYQTLSQYRPDLEIAFAAIGDAGCDRYPLQVTDFSKGFGLEDRLHALYGEGGGGDAPESYQLFAYYMTAHVFTPGVARAAAAGSVGDGEPDGERPFLIVFGDQKFHPRVTAGQVKRLLGHELGPDLGGVAVWREVAERWNVYFLRRPDGGKRGDDVHKQWAAAIGDQKIVYIDDELRGVDYAMGLIARSWGKLDDFQHNMLARHDPAKVAALANSLLARGGDGRRPTAPSPVRRFEIPDTRRSDSSA